MVLKAGESPNHSSRGSDNLYGGIDTEMFPYHALSFRSTGQDDAYRPGGFGWSLARSSE
ncbi:hypothetical protein BS47DRAFT_1346643 [Hydnum rufescens UP504]|uniref:Uncharacterized protein n=1 Tax=Hydnum rufescens UP504 TaxID=1448309 RepID=A0A9P6DVF4_9AGAM|nr:hypothetical protein BS47DRAFT_1346643 [Hydnum rufescens UP504]